MKSVLLLTLLVIAGSFLAGCKAPDDATQDAKKNDATAKINKQAGGDE